MMPSIFNDVIGPVMRGPSSSHTAAAHRIGTVIRQICPGEVRNVMVELDREGSLPQTYVSQGSEMGLICGLLGVSILDSSVFRYKHLAKERGLTTGFQITDLGAGHPNAYIILTEDDEHSQYRFEAVSTGGGMIEIQKINGFKVMIRGDYFETLIFGSSTSDEVVNNLFDRIKHLIPHSEIVLSRNEPEDFLINLKSREPSGSELRSLLSASGVVTRVQEIKPVLPIPAGAELPIPFTTVDQMLKLSRENNYDLADLASIYECARSGFDAQKIFTLMEDIARTLENSVREGMTGTVYKDRILGRQSHLIRAAEKVNKIINTPSNKIISYVTALMEVKSSMGIIVAAPTAGSAGVLGGAIFAIAEELNASFDSIVESFLAAGLIGVIIAHKYTFAAEVGGCQVECGAASAMAAAGLVQLMGGTTQQAINASSMALSNLLGMICDPVAGRVEVPCLGKNILGATNALDSAIMSISGFDPVIPLEEVIEAMKSVGDSMPASLRCTGLGGLSVTPASLRIHNELNDKPYELD
jgi:L-serine dehydratase